MSSTASPPGLRISLREFLLLFTAVVVACAALKFANDYWVAAVSLVTLLAFMAATIIALIDRDARQVFAIGFIAAGAIYLGVLFSSPKSSEFAGPSSDTLPITRLLQSAFEIVAETCIGI